VKLKDVFVRILKSRGIKSVSTNINRIIESDDVLQMMAVYVILNRAKVCRGFRGRAYDLNGNPVDYADAFVGRCRECDVLLTRDEMLKEVECEYFPYIVVDCSFFDDHTEKEKRKILLQIEQTLGVVRKYMWDERLIITHLNCGLGEYYSSTAEFIKNKNIRDVILLDPSGDEVFRGERAECFIIGGIVDKSGEKKGWTSRIGDALEREGIRFRSMRILLRGDTVGVPDRINTIAEIVLKVVMDGMDVEKAVKDVQSPLVAKWRLRKELPKRTVRVDVNGKPFRIVKKSIFSEFDWLNIRIKDFYDVCSELGYLVMDDCKFDELVKNAKWDEKKHRYILKYK